jgi:hypothetical protein
MQAASEEFSALLDRERQAALSADVDALASLQDEKRAWLSRVKNGEFEAALADDLIARAHSNVGLIRNLVICLRGVLEADSEPTYTSRGLRSIAPEGSLRGKL